MVVVQEAVLAAALEGSNQSFNGQPLEYWIRPYVGYLTFGIDIAAGTIIAISAATALFAFFRILRKSPWSKLKRKRQLDCV